MTRSIAVRADFARVRYAQCWEDADILLAALNVQPGDVCLSITSGGDNVLALASRAPARIIALDLSAAQMACLELRIAAFRCLEHEEVLELIGSRPSIRRLSLYHRCRSTMTADAREFWDRAKTSIERGIGHAGKFERYLTLFRTCILPLVHSRQTIDRLLAERSPSERQEFYCGRWDTTLWNVLFRGFCSRPVLGRLGRDPSFFLYANGNVAEHLLPRIRHALIDLDPADNPYLHWMLKGQHGNALPFALRRENFDAIRTNLDCIELRCQSLEDFLESTEPGSIDSFNLSDVFEYMAPDDFRLSLERLSRCGKPGARLAYWNFLAQRHRPPELRHRLRPQIALAKELFQQDKAFFYSDFVVEDVI